MAAARESRDADKHSERGISDRFSTEPGGTEHAVCIGGRKLCFVVAVPQTTIGTGRAERCSHWLVGWLVAWR